MKTQAEWDAWWADETARRVVLIETSALVAGVSTDIYMSAGPAYNTRADEVPANTHYAPIASINGAFFVEALEINGSGGGLSAGEIGISNPNGVRDAWLRATWTWKNRPLRAYVGDASWDRDDFDLIFDGISANLLPKDSNSHALKLRDKSQQLNTPITEQKLGGTGPNRDMIIPLCFGSVHNFSPLLVDPVTLEYAGHNGQVESIFEVRDLGVPLPDGVDASPLTGRFQLLEPPVGAITATIQGDAPGGVYSNTVSKLVQRLVKAFGTPSRRLTDADLDTSNLAAFEAAHPQPVGLPVYDRLFVGEACRQLASSLGAQVSFSRLGKLRLLKLHLPAANPTRSVYPKHMLRGELIPVDRTEAIAAVKLGFNRNWTMQPGLQTGIPPEHKALFDTEWLTSTAVDPTAQADNQLSADPEQEGTLLLRRVDADAEAQRRLNMWKTPHTMYEFTGLHELMDLELGDVITVYHHRYDMENGVNAVVVSVGPIWDKAQNKVRIIV
jgi:hypothetical protein